MSSSATLEFDGFTVEQIVEQQGPFLDVSDFFPGLHPEILEEHRGWMEPRFLDPVS